MFKLKEGFAYLAAIIFQTSLRGSVALHDKSTMVKEYKLEIETLQKDKDNMAKKVGELTLEKDFLEGKLVSLASSKERRVLVDTELNISLNKQCQ